MSNNNFSEIAKSIGGQAIIEGVMMRGKYSYTLAVRNINSKNLIVETYPIEKPSHFINFRNIPFIRGVFSFFSSMTIGYKILSRSATLSGLDSGEKSNLEKWIDNKFSGKSSEFFIYFSIILSLILSISIFMLLPVWITTFITSYFNLPFWAIGIFEGLIRIFIFLFYLLIISNLEDVKRIFMYHGAEHKTITCFEKGDPLTIENVRKHSRLHKRCGTSFLIIVMLVSMLLFMFLKTDNLFIRFFSRIIFLPLIAGFSYEFIKLASKYDNLFIKIISYPGLSLQKITTKEPSDDMIEAAIKALEGVLNYKNS